MSVSIFISAMNNKYYIKISFICISIFFVSRHSESRNMRSSFQRELYKPTCILYNHNF